MDIAVTMDPRDPGIHFGEQEGRHIHSGTRDIEAGSEGVVAVAICRREAQQGGIQRPAPGSKQRRNLRKEAGEVVDRTMVEQGPDIGTYEKIGDAKVVTEPGKLGGFRALGVDVEELDFLEPRSLADQLAEERPRSGRGAMDEDAEPGPNLRDHLFEAAGGRAHLAHHPPSTTISVPVT